MGRVMFVDACPPPPFEVIAHYEGALHYYFYELPLDEPLWHCEGPGAGAASNLATHIGRYQAPNAKARPPPGRRARPFGFGPAKPQCTNTGVNDLNDQCRQRSAAANEIRGRATGEAWGSSRVTKVGGAWQL